jgi:hypothetical protein
MASIIAEEGFSSIVSKKNVSPFRLQLSVGCLTSMDKCIATAHPGAVSQRMGGGHRAIT